MSQGFDFKNGLGSQKMFWNEKLFGISKNALGTQKIVMESQKMVDFVYTVYIVDIVDSVDIAGIIDTVDIAYTYYLNNLKNVTYLINEHHGSNRC